MQLAQKEKRKTRKPNATKLVLFVKGEKQKPNVNLILEYDGAPHSMFDGLIFAKRQAIISSQCDGQKSERERQHKSNCSLERFKTKRKKEKGKGKKKQSAVHIIVHEPHLKSHRWSPRSPDQSKKAQGLHQVPRLHQEPRLNQERTQRPGPTCQRSDLHKRQKQTKKKKKKGKGREGGRSGEVRRDPCKSARYRSIYIKIYIYDRLSQYHSYIPSPTGG